MTAKLAKIHKPYVAWKAPPGVFGHGSMHVERVILHDTECHDAAGITEIEGVAHFWEQTAFESRLASQFIVDGDGNIGECAEPEELCYHTGGLNTGSIGIEQIGFATFTEDDWLRRTHQMLAVAKLLAWIHTTYRVPLRVPVSQGHGLPMQGVMTHAMVSRFEASSLGHTDPGSGFPLGMMLAMANGFVKAGGWPVHGQLPQKPGAGGGGVPSGGQPKPKRRITVRGGQKLEVIGHTAGVTRYVLRHRATIRKLRAGGNLHLHFDEGGEQ